MEVHFHIGMIKANGISSSSALNVGTNLLIGFASATKSASGGAQNNGDSGSFPALFSLMDDRDLVDFPTWLTTPER